MKEEETNDGYEGQKSDSNSKKKVTRSNPYVVRNVIDSIDFVSVIYTELGYHEYHDKEDIAKVHNSNYDAIKQRLSTCQQYGLLEIKHGTGYKPTDLFVSIYLPDNDDNYRHSVIESIQRPYAFKYLIEKFGSHSIPALTGIQNTLMKDLGYKRDIALKISNIFLENLKSFSLLNSNNVITLTKSSSITNQTVHDEKKAVSNDNTQQSDIQNEKNVPKEITGVLPILIPMKSTNEKAYLYLPENYKEEDLDRILKFVEALK